MRVALVDARLNAYQIDTEDGRSISGISFKAMGLTPVGARRIGRQVSAAASPDRASADVVAHVPVTWRPHPRPIGAEVTLHPQEDRVVIGIARQHRTAPGVTLFLPRAELAG